MPITPSTIPQILTTVELLQPAEGEVILILFAEFSVPDIPQLIDTLNGQNIIFFGGVFPGLIYKNQRLTTGCIIKKFKALMGPFCVTGIATTQFSELPHFFPGAGPQKNTVITLLDGLSPNIYRLLEKLNDSFGEHCNFIGAGAGSISLKQQPCVFSNAGFEEDAAVVCVIDKEIHLGVRHGWEHLAGPLVATQTDGNTILKLNWQKAIDVYNKIVEADCGVSLNKENFAGIAQGYPFGIMRDKEDDIVRDPLTIGEDGSIVCIGEVPANTVLHVLKGRSSTLLNAARQALNDCGENLGLPIRAESTFVVDCITRALFLDNEFEEEINIIRDNLIIDREAQEPFGVLSLGELSSYGDGLLELFNKTIVIGSFTDA